MMEIWNDGFEGILSIKNGLSNFITQHSIIPDGWDYDIAPVNHIISICYRNSDTLNYSAYPKKFYIGRNIGPTEAELK